jgi:hypothetical protein
MKIIPEKRVVRTEFDIYVFMSVVTPTRLCYAKTLISNALCRGRFVCLFNNLMRDVVLLLIT